MVSWNTPNGKLQYFRPFCLGSYQDTRWRYPNGSCSWGPDSSETQPRETREGSVGKEPVYQGKDSPAQWSLHWQAVAGTVQYTTPPADQRLLDRFNASCSEYWMVATHIDGGVLHVLKITDRFRRKFDRDCRSSCPKLEGDTFCRMLGVTPQRKHPNDEQDALTKSAASLPCSTPTRTPATSQSVTTAVAAAAVVSEPTIASPVCRPKPAATTSTAALRPASTAAAVQISSWDSLEELPKQVLAKILECLDGVQQMRVCRVCSAWNQILAMSRMFHVPQEGGSFGSMYPRACLLKRWTAQTKVIVYSMVVKTGSIFDSNVDRFPELAFYGRLLCAGRFFRCIFKEKKLPRLDKLLLGALVWEWRGSSMMRSFSDFVCYIRAELNVFASVCHSLVLRKVTVVVGGNKTPVIVRFANVRIEGKISVDTLWDLMDKCLPPLSEENVVCWREWLGDNSSNSLPAQLVEILDQRQSADPRDSNQFRGRKWIRADLATLDLEKLNRTTAHSLVKTCCYEKLLLVLHS